MPLRQGIKTKVSLKVHHIAASDPPLSRSRCPPVHPYDESWLGVYANSMETNP
jgi:hypothetical protein